MLTEAPLSVGLISLGCAKNLVDTQVMSGVLLTEGLTLAHDANHADVVLINTCAFIQSARDEAAAVINEMCAHKAAGGCRAIVVAGCLPQRYRNRLILQFPGVDAWIGVDELESIADVVLRAVAATQVKDSRPIVAVTAQPTALFAPRLPTLAFANPSCAYLKIAEGCNHACAFCAIPGIRGRFRSRPLPELVAEARALLKDNRRELNLIAQDTSSYGRDRRGGPRLADLIQSLDSIRGKFWLRLLYAYPSRMTDEFLAVLAGARHVVPYLDLPIQHSHPDVLRAMQRADTVKMMPDLVARLRTAVPKLALRTTCLVGFPGETEAHFAHLVDFVKQARFDHLGVFAFSPEAGTPAASLPDPVPAAVAEARRATLMEVQQTIVAAHNRARIGTATEVLLQQPPAAGRRGRWVARTAWQAPDVDGVTVVSGLPANVGIGDFVKVRITGIDGYDLVATAGLRKR
jgi:ribosomal protein S12 methylthiotransferase